MKEILEIDTMVIAKDKNNIKRELRFKCPAIIETKDTFCVKHNRSYTAECHYLPSGKEYWTECPYCKTQTDGKKAMQAIKSHLENNDMKFDHVNETWVSSKIEMVEQPVTKRRNIF